MSMWKIHIHRYGRWHLDNKAKINGEVNAIQYRVCRDCGKIKVRRLWP
jgi:hypothetical protein